MSDSLRKLIAKWRSTVEFRMQSDPAYREGPNAQLSNCADQLEEVLPAIESEINQARREAQSAIHRDLKAFRGVVELHISPYPIDSYAEGVIDAYRACAHQLDKFLAQLSPVQQEAPKPPKVLTQRDIDRIAARSPELAVYYCVCGGVETKNHTQACRDNMSRLNDMQRALHDAYHPAAAPTEQEAIPEGQCPHGYAWGDCAKCPPAVIDMPSPHVAPIPVNEPMCTRCGKMFLECQCDRAAAPVMEEAPKPQRDSERCENCDCFTADPGENCTNCGHLVGTLVAAPPHISGERLSEAERDEWRHALIKTISSANDWHREFNMYRTAWLREMGGEIRRKAHEIDGFVLRTQDIYEGYKQVPELKKRIAELEAVIPQTGERQRELAKIVELSEQKDGAYRERDCLVAALSKLFPSTLERHPESDTTWEDDWRWIVFVTLPTGQATWHIHDSELSQFDHLKRNTGQVWDGHSTPVKYTRLAALATPQQTTAASGSQVKSTECEACARGEKWIKPPWSSIVGNAAVHTPSGNICTATPEWIELQAAISRAATAAQREKP